jgi:hypothetical protein
VFQLGAIVELGVANPAGCPPQQEDYSFDSTKALLVSKVSHHAFWTDVEHDSKGDLCSIFGIHLRNRGTNAVVNLGTGAASLGELQVNHKPELYVNNFGKLRMAIQDLKLGKLDLSVTDVRFYEYDGIWKLRSGAVSSALGRIETSDPANIILAVGLTRAWKGFHWLQVNNVYFRDNPLWAESSTRQS